MRRAFALIAAGWLVLAFALGARHEASEAHVIDAHGDAVHAVKIVAAHHCTHADIHALDGEPCGSQPCDIVAALHQPISKQVALPANNLAVLAFPRPVASPADDLPSFGLTVLRVAPKTSPPRA